MGRRRFRARSASLCGHARHAARDRTSAKQTSRFLHATRTIEYCEGTYAFIHVRAIGGTAITTLGYHTPGRGKYRYDTANELQTNERRTGLAPSKRCPARAVTVLGPGTSAESGAQARGEKEEKDVQRIYSNPSAGDSIVANTNTFVCETTRAARAHNGDGDGSGEGTGAAGRAGRAR